MGLMLVIGDGGRPSYAVYTDETDVVAAAVNEEAASVLRGSRTADTIERLEAAGQAVADACEHILIKVREGLADAAPSELELTFKLGFSGEGGMPVLFKASTEAGVEVRALWKKGEADGAPDPGPTPSAS